MISITFKTLLLCIKRCLQGRCRFLLPELYLQTLVSVFCLICHLNYFQNRSAYINNRLIGHNSPGYRGIHKIFARFFSFPVKISALQWLTFCSLKFTQYELSMSIYYRIIFLYILVPISTEVFSIP